MRIGGLQKYSLIDYPGKLSCVIFTQGCNFRCPYCHNRELVLPEHFKDPVFQDDVLDFLRARRLYLDGVVVTGGEPTEQEDLLDFLKIVKELGYLLKLDTNGSRPEVIREIFNHNLLDFIAMDIKTSFEKYPKAIGVNFPIEKIKESMDLIKSSKIPHQFRTTVVRPFCEFEDLSSILTSVNDNENYHLQSFKESPKMINPNIQKIDQFSSEEVKRWNKML